MPVKNVIREKSFAFAIEIVSISKQLFEQKAFVLSRQLLRSGTSIGANVRESEHAVSRADFINKLSIALKEANETDYWLDLLYQSHYLSETEFSVLKKNNSELLRLLVKIVKTLKQK